MKTKHEDSDLTKRNLIKRGLAGLALTTALVGSALSGVAAAHSGPHAHDTVAATAVDTTQPSGPTTLADQTTPTPPRRTKPRRVGKLAAANVAKAGSCDVEFDGSDALLVQPDHAKDQFVTQPWRESCGNVWTEMKVPTYQHFHLGYVDPDIGPCFNPDEDEAGTYARIIGDDPFTATCEPIDPLTEPRISPRVHLGSEVVKFRMYDGDGYQPFRLDRIRVKDTPIRLCVKPFGVGGFKAAGGAQGGNSKCWTLNAGYWNLSKHTDGTGLVTMTGVNGDEAPFSFDDIRVTDQS